MEKLLFLFLQAGIFGSSIIILSLILRLLAQKAPRQLLCVCWLLAMVRLVPFHIESQLSLQPNLPWLQQVQQETPKQELQGDEMPLPEQPSENIEALPEQAVPAPILPPPVAETPEVTLPEPHQEAPTQPKIWTVLSVVWLAGVLVGGLGIGVSYLSMNRRVRNAHLVEDGVFECANIREPFLLGYWRPRIYLPCGVSLADRVYIIAHEKAHISRGDNWWKLLGAMLVCLHWFNPLVWLGYILFCRDTEVACDERVVCTLDMEGRKAYALALLNRGKAASGLSLVSLSFGKEKLRKRIEYALKYRNAGLWVTLATGMLVALIAVCFLTTPKQPTQQTAFVPEERPTTETTQTVTGPTQTVTVPTPPTTAPTQGPTAPTQPETTPPEDVGGTCGENVTWTLQGNVLTLGGTGKMTGFDSDTQQPWAAYRSRITTVEIGSGVLEIGKYAFTYCGNLKNIVFASDGKLQTIGDYAFAYTGLQKLNTPPSLYTVGKLAFAYCRELETVRLENGVQKIQDFAFDGCAGIKRLALGASVTYVSYHAFPFFGTVEHLEVFTQHFSVSGKNCLHLKTVLFAGDPRSHFSLNPSPELTEVRIETKVDTIGANAFGTYSDVEKTMIFKTDAPKFDERAFSGMTVTVYYPADNSTWTEEVRQNYGGNVTWIPGSP